MNLRQREAGIRKLPVATGPDRVTLGMSAQDELRSDHATVVSWLT